MNTSRKPKREGCSGKRAIRYAVIGLGHIAQAAVLPAFAHAKSNSTLAALVSGQPKKLKALGRRYGVTHLCDYQDADTLFMSGEIDAVYIAVPNDMHKEFTVRAACILDNRTPAPSGEEGLVDVRIIEAMLRSIKGGRWVDISPSSRRQRPSLKQDIRRPPVPQEPTLVDVESASQ
jgi:predicted dehydrogenase